MNDMKIIIEQSDFHAISRAIALDWKLSHRIKDTVSVLANHIKNDSRHSLDSLMVGSIATGNATHALLRELITQVLVGVEIVTERGSHIKHKEVLDAVADATAKIEKSFDDERRKQVMDSLREEKDAFEEFLRDKKKQKKKGDK